MTAGAAEIAPEETTTYAVRCADLSYHFGTHTAVDHVDLNIAPGEMFGLLGPNGAGKTTTIRMLTTLLKPATGTVTEAGAARIEQWRDIRAELASRALDRLAPADRQALKAAVPALARLAEQMEEL